MVVSQEGEFRELTWQDLDPSNKHKKVGRTEVLGWIMASLIGCVIFIMLAPVQELILSDDQLVSMYTRRFAWLNRCDRECEKVVNTRMLDAQDNCGVLQQWYKMERRRDLLEWRIAIDDRASGLGCSGFPLSMDLIEQSVRRTDIQRRQRIANLQREKQAEIEEELAQQIQRYEAAIKEGGIFTFAYKFYQDPVNQDIMVLALTDEFFALPYRTQLQVAEVYWKKWVNIRAPLDPESPRIRILNVENVVVGGSPPEAASPIWIREPGA